MKRNANTTVVLAAAYLNKDSGGLTCVSHTNR